MNNRIAVLIDAENISYKHTDNIFNALKNEGDIVIKKAYGDFSNAGLANWKDATLNHAIEAVQRFSYSSGKSSSDSAMNIDAMDMLYGNQADIFVLVSSDSDFTNLAIRLRNEHKKVIGMGSKQASNAFKLACDDYRYIDDLEKLASEQQTETKTVEIPKAFVGPAPLKYVKEIIGAAIDKNANIEGTMLLGEVGGALKREIEDFNFKNYGNFKNLGAFVESMPEFELIKDNRYTPPVNLIKKNGKKSGVKSCQAKQQPAADVKYCIKCGAKTEQTHAFCSRCGNALIKN